MPQLNPWLSMWTQPRKTIRWVVQTNPQYGVFYLSAAYIFQSLFFIFNFWSLGLTFHHVTLLLASLFAAPILGTVWIWVYGSILQYTGRWFGGKAPSSHIRAALAWSRLPMIPSLFLWGYLWLTQPDEMFIQYGPGATVLILHALLGALKGWTIILFVQSIREVQQYSLLKALSNMLTSWAIYFLLFLSVSLIILAIYPR